MYSQNTSYFLHVAHYGDINHRADITNYCKYTITARKAYLAAKIFQGLKIILARPKSFPRKRRVGSDMKLNNSMVSTWLLLITTGIVNLGGAELVLILDSVP